MYQLNEIIQLILPFPVLVFLALANPPLLPEERQSYYGIGMP